MNIQMESNEQKEKKLARVIRNATLKVYNNPYCFHEFGKDLTVIPPKTLAIVMDDDGHSALVPATENETETYLIFRFHFDALLDNSGFVGWLASNIKNKLGAGVFVLCGKNSRKGGIYDYWGCDWEIGTAVIEVVNELRKTDLLEQ